MNLETQIQVLAFTFVYGMSISFIFNLFYKFLFSDKLIFKIFYNLLFSIFICFLYFFILRKINNAIFHSYLIITLLIGFFIGNIKTRIIRKK